MKDKITHIDNNSKEELYCGIYIRDIYHYLNIIGAPTNFTYSIRHLNYFDIRNITNSGLMNNIIEYIIGIHRIPCDCCGFPGYKSEHFIIIGTNLLPSSILGKNIQYN